jgi:DNA-binding response OmpR family regulator
MAHNRNVYRFFAVPTVLIVEDNRALAHAVAEVLRSIGYGTLIAHDGEAALSEAERSRPEVALVDLELPAIDGLEVARRLREGYGKQIRLIANTAWPDNAETHSKTTDAGFDDVLIKPTSDLSDYQGRSAQRKATCLVMAVRLQDPAVQCRTRA